MAFSRLRRRVKRFRQKIQIRRRARAYRRTAKKYRGIVGSASDVREFYRSDRTDRRNTRRRFKKQLGRKIRKNKKVLGLSSLSLLAIGVGVYYYFNRKK